MAKAKDLREQSDQELQAQCEDLRQEIFQMKNALAMRKEEIKPNAIREKRKDVARILTILAQRQSQ